MPFDAAHWCAFSQVNLSIVLCSRYHEYVTVQILLIATCKKDQGYSNSCLNVMQIHIWTSWLRWRFFDCDVIHFVWNYKICGNVCWLIFSCFSMFECCFYKSKDLMLFKKVTCSCPLMPLIDVQFPRSTSQLFCARGTMDM